MAVSHGKGDDVYLTEEPPGPAFATAGPGRGARVGGRVDSGPRASVFILHADGKARSDDDFILHNGKTGLRGAVRRMGGNGTGEGDGAIGIDLSRVPSDMEKPVFAIAIHEADIHGRNFDRTSNAYTRPVSRASGSVLVKYDLSEDRSTGVATVFGALGRHDEERKMKAIGARRPVRTRGIGLAQGRTGRDLSFSGGRRRSAKDGMPSSCPDGFADHMIRWGGRR